jgi:hypothetical protein
MGRQRFATRVFGVALMTVGAGLAIPATAPADERQDTIKHERQLQAEAKQLDADATRASKTSDGQQRVTERIASQFKVEPSVVTDLRSRKLGFGSATIALALSQELMKQDSTLTQQAALDKIFAERAAGKGWGVIAHDLGLKLGPVVSEVHKAGKATEQVAGKTDKMVRAEKTEKVEKVEKPAKPEKIEKIERPAKPEKPGR